MIKSPTIEQYRMRRGCRLSHPVYGTGTYLHGRTLGGISTIAVEWDRKPALHDESAAQAGY